MSQRNQSKLKHWFGLVHSLVFLVLPFVPSGVKLEIDLVLRFSLVYYIQDIFWSLKYNEFLVVLHHLGLIALWSFVLDDTKMLYRAQIIERAMLWPELSAFLIHIKFLFPYHVTHVICLISYPITRCIVFPIYAGMYMYSIGQEVGWSSKYVWGMVAHILVVVFSSAILIEKMQLFYDAFRCKKLNGALKQKNM